jgi:F0F1-type ATP synthase assembly protein I
MPHLDEKEQLEKRSAIASALSLGMNFAVGMAVFAAGGWWIDQKRGGGEAFTLAGIFLGLLYGAYEVWKTVKALEK